MGDNIFVQTQCFFCKQDKDRVLYPARLNRDSFTGYTFSARRERKREHYQIVACKECTLVRSSPIIDEGKLNTLYADSQFIFSQEAPFVCQSYAVLVRKLIDKYTGKVESLLEIGCSTGFFLEKALEMGITDVVGFEPSRDCYEHARNHIKDRIINDIYKPDLLGDKKFDLICSFHVLDHLRDPQKTLSSMAEGLNPGGHVLLVCHDVDSWSAKLLGDYSPIFDVEHIYLFSKKTITLLLESVGLDVVELGLFVNTYPLRYWMRMLPITNKIVRLMPKFLKNIPISVKAGNLYVYGQKG